MDASMGLTGRLIATAALTIVALIVLAVGAIVIASVGWSEGGASGNGLPLALIGVVTLVVVGRCAQSVWRVWHAH